MNEGLPPIGNQASVDMQRQGEQPNSESSVRSEPWRVVKENPNSVEISVNQKGVYSGKVKVYADTIESAWNQSVDYADKLANLIAEKNGGKD